MLQSFCEHLTPFSRSLNQRIYSRPYLWSTSLPQPMTVIFFKLQPWEVSKTPLHRTSIVLSLWTRKYSAKCPPSRMTLLTSRLWALQFLAPPLSNSFKLLILWNTWISAMFPSGSNGPDPLRSLRLHEYFPFLHTNLPKFFPANSRICCHVPPDNQQLGYTSLFRASTVSLTPHLESSIVAWLQTSISASTCLSRWWMVLTGFRT